MALSFQISLTIVGPTTPRTLVSWRGGTELQIPPSNQESIEVTSGGVPAMGADLSKAKTMAENAWT